MLGKADVTAFAAVSPSMVENLENTALPVSDGVVEVIDYTLIQADAQKNQCRDLVEDTSRVFGLHPEQDRAFRIIANHAAGGHPQLKLYIGGMALVNPK